MRCPICDSKDVKKTSKEEWFPVDGKNVLVKYKCYECQNCTEIWIDGTVPDPFEIAKKEASNG